MTHKRTKGNVGEDIAAKYLGDLGFVIIDRNYYKKWGELDIIARKDNKLHFFEVKSIIGDYSKGQKDHHRPEDNVDGWKIKHLRRIIETYLSEKEGSLDIEFQFHIICVYMDIYMRMKHIEMLRDIIL